ncbi:MAG: hypothetical protein V8R55_04260 [Dysosmobacter sp.]
MAMGWLSVKCAMPGRTAATSPWWRLHPDNPCVIISSYQLEFSPDMVRAMRLSFGAAVLLHLLMLVLTDLLRRPLHLSPVEQASVIYSNAATSSSPSSPPFRARSG